MATVSGTARDVRPSLTAPPWNLHTPYVAIGRSPRRSLSILGLLVAVFCGELVSAEEQRPKSELVFVPDLESRLDAFRGFVRVWRIQWALDGAGQPSPGAVSITVSQYGQSTEGVEHWGLTWKYPFRPDLTPDLSYVRVGDGRSIHIDGNSNGPRAIVVATPSEDSSRPLYELLNGPCAGFSDQHVGEALSRIEWRPNDASTEALDQWCSSLGSGETETAQLVIQPYAGNASTPDLRWSSIRACLLNADVSNTANDEAATTQFSPLAIDLRAQFDDPASPDWNGTFSASYRALRLPPASHGELTSQQPTEWGVVPEIAFWEEQCTRPRSPDKSYHRVAIAFIQATDDPTFQLTDSWEAVLPQLRIADMTDGSARIGPVSHRNQCGAWKFLTHLDSDSAAFINLLNTDLGGAFPFAWSPISATPRGQSTDELPLGTCRNTGPRLPTADLQLPSMSADAFSAVLEAWDAAGSPADGSLPHHVHGPLPNPRFPGLLSALIRIQADQQSKHSQAALPQRQSDVPVNDADRSTAVVALTAICSAPAVLLAVPIWRSLRRRRLGLMLLLVGLAGSSDAVHASSGGAGGESSQCTNSETQACIRAHCESAARIRHNINITEVVRLFCSHHAAILQQLPDASPTTALAPPSFAATMSHLTQYYDCILQPLRDDPGPFDASSTDGDLPTLASTLNGKAANCFTVSLLYYLHCHLLSVDASIIAVPGHAMLCQKCPARDLTASGNPPSGLMLIYDPSRKRMLTTTETADVMQAEHCILSASQLVAVFMYNCGTLLCRRGAHDLGRVALQDAITCGFPFPDALYNLCVSLAQGERFKDLIAAVGNGNAPRADFDLAPHSSLREHHLVHDIAVMNVRAMIASGDHQAALAAAERELQISRLPTDFRLYRTYCTLKHRVSDVYSR